MGRQHAGGERGPDYGLSLHPLQDHSCHFRADEGDIALLRGYCGLDGSHVRLHLKPFPFNSLITVTCREQVGHACQTRHRHVKMRRPIFPGSAFVSALLDHLEKLDVVDK